MCRGKLSITQRRQIYTKYGGHCAYCGVMMPMSEMRVDYVEQPSSAENDTLENMLPACQSCSIYKHVLGTIEAFRASIERLPEALAQESTTYRKAVRFGMVEPKPHKVVFYFEWVEKQRLIIGMKD